MKLFAWILFTVILIGLFAVFGWWGILIYGLFIALSRLANILLNLKEENIIEPASPRDLIAPFLFIILILLIPFNGLRNRLYYKYFSSTYKEQKDE